MNNEILFKPNPLIMAKSNCDNIKSNEYKVYDAVLQRCQYHKGYGFRKAELKREEIKKIVKTNDYSTIKEISNIFEKFMDIILKFKLGTQHITSSAIAEYVYDESNNTFSLSVSENVFHVLSEYSRYGYSPIDLKLVRKTRSYYTQKIYGMFRMWSKINETIVHSYKLTEIKDICDIYEGTCYDEYKIFKRDVLKKSLKEIKEKLNMDVEIVKENRVNRKIVSIEFSILDYEPRRYNFDTDKIISAESSKIENEADTSSKIDSIDYVNLIDMNLRESIHKRFLSDFSDYKNYIEAVELAGKRTLDAIGGKSINTRNYKYFKVTLENLIGEAD